MKTTPVFRRIPPIVAGSLLVVGALGIAPVPAQEAQENDSIADARAEQEAIRREAALVAAEIDLLNAEDEEVAAALVDLQAFIAQTDADIEGALHGITQAEADAAAAEVEAERLEAEIGAARHVVRTFAVSAYVRSDSSRLDLLLGSDDPRAAEMRRFFTNLVDGNADDAVGEFRRLQDDQDLARREANEARDRAAVLRDELETKRAELADAVAAQEAVRADIASRIDNWEGESAALAAADAEVTAFIQAEQARVEAARQEEIRRQQEAERQRQLETERLEAEPQDETDRVDGDTAAPREDTAIDELGGESNADDVVLPPSSAPTGFVWPTSGAIVSNFGWRIHPVFGTERFHAGLDINGSTGQPIAASAPGVVITAGWMDGYGNVVIIAHGGGFSTLYAHQSQVATTVGASVGQGEIIGYVGSTGWSTGPHLHFEIRVDGSSVDPSSYL